MNGAQVVGGGGLPFARFGSSFCVFSLFSAVAVCLSVRRAFVRFRVWRCVVRFAVSILTPFFAVSRLVSARLVYYIKATKKARLWAIFKAFSLVRFSVSVLG